MFSEYVVSAPLNQVVIGMDVAASEFYNEKEKTYDLNFKEDVSMLVLGNVVFKIQYSSLLEEVFLDMSSSYLFSCLYSLYYVFVIVKPLCIFDILRILFEMCLVWLMLTWSH